MSTATEERAENGVASGQAKKGTGIGPRDAARALTKCLNILKRLEPAFREPCYKALGGQLELLAIEEGLIASAKVQQEIQ